MFMANFGWYLDIDIRISEIASRHTAVNTSAVPPLVQTSTRAGKVSAKFAADAVSNVLSFTNVICATDMTCTATASYAATTITVTMQRQICRLYKQCCQAPHAILI